MNPIGTGLSAIILALSLFGRAFANPHDDANAADQRKDYVAELAILRPQAGQGQAWAQNNLGNLYAAGHGVPRDDSQAVHWYRLAADQGDAGGELNLGEMYERGEAVAKDETAAARLYLDAARRGNAEALPMLLFLCMPSTAAAPEDCDQAGPILQDEAARGNVDAQNELAGIYDSGMFFGLPKDPALAAFWRRKAAEQGSERAQAELAERYELGVGVPKDDAQAVFWLRKAADQSDMLSQIALADRYEKGQGVPQDEAQAFDWRLKAAEQGFPSAQREVGTAYALGKGAPRDDVQAYMWLDIALRSTPADAEDRDAETLALDDVAARLKPADLARAKRLAAAWKAKSDTP
jgi:TPR repeat protein